MKESIKENEIIDKRNYGRDALRLIAMFGVVILHVLGRGYLQHLPAVHGLFEKEELLGNRVFIF